MTSASKRHPQGLGTRAIHAGQQPDPSTGAKFRFRRPLALGTYFMNAGICARIGEEETFLDRLVYAALFRVAPDPGHLATGLVDFHVQPQMEILVGKDLGVCGAS